MMRGVMESIVSQTEQAQAALAGVTGRVVSQTEHAKAASATLEAPQAGGAYPDGMLLEDQVQLLQVIPPVSRPHTGHDVVRGVGCAKGTVSSQLHHHQLVSKIMTICTHMS